MTSEKLQAILDLIGNLAFMAFCVIVLILVIRAKSRDHKDKGQDQDE
jgi:hypothetical protein